MYVRYLSLSLVSEIFSTRIHPIPPPLIVDEESVQLWNYSVDNMNAGAYLITEPVDLSAMFPDEPPEVGLHLPRLSLEGFCVIIVIIFGVSLAIGFTRS